MKRRAGYTFIVLMAVVTILAIGLLVAVPVWETQIRREAEEELIFRGLQYVEAIRVYQTKNPGRFPESIDELVKSRCLRKPFPDPMTKDGRWDLILQPEGTAAPSARPAGRPAAGQAAAASPPNLSRIFVVPAASVSSVKNPRLLGVVSRSTRSSLRIYNDQDTYDAWLFYYGMSPGSQPEIVRFGRSDK